MKVLVIGQGGREHALAHTFWSQGHSVYCSPGNAGTQLICEETPDIPVHEHIHFANLAKEFQVDLTVVGPEIPLSEGIGDVFASYNLPLFGPRQNGSIIESNKSWAKIFMEKYNIPTARYQVCRNAEEAREKVKENFDKWEGVVIKPSGLTAGKGVICCETFDEALEAIQVIMEDEKYGSSGNQVVIEEYLKGKEVSLLAFCDGKTITPMIPSQDHKRLLEGDQGPNTGGVGAYSPTPFLTDTMMETVRRHIIERTNNGLQEEGINYQGVLYFGIMLTNEGPKVLEYNCRFGDPEAQAVLPLIKSDLAEVMLACYEGKLNEIKIEWKNLSSCCVIMVSKGYPETHQTGFPITGVDYFDKKEDLFCFHSGTKRHIDGKVLSKGGRVLGITGLGNTLEQAIIKAYSGIEKIHFENAFYREDIAHQVYDRTRIMI